MSSALRNAFQVDSLHVRVYADRSAAGTAAAAMVEERLAGLLEFRERVRIVFAAAPSQQEMLEDLARSTRVDWTRVEAFHMDEYIGLPQGAEQSFAHFLNTRLFDRLPFAAVHRICPESDSEAEDRRYERLLRERPIDVVCLGVGENGHLAFNDPPVAAFGEPLWVKRVELAPACRAQQVHDGCFSSIEEVPTHALTLTIPALFSGESLYCVVPGATKRNAVARMLGGAVAEDCPATILRRHRRCVLFLDGESARGIEGPVR